MNAWLLPLAGLVLLVRLSALRRFWRLPDAEATRVLFRAGGAGEAAAARLLRRYRASLLATFLFDLALVPWLLATHREHLLPTQQLLGLLLTAVGLRLVAVHFQLRFRALATPAGGPAPAAAPVQLPLRRRGPAQHTLWALEILLVALHVAALGLIVWSGALRDDPGARAATLWLLYAQLGFLLLKRAFASVRLPVGLARAEAYLRWREAWLTYHARIFDGLRVVVALMLFTLGVDAALVPLTLPAALVAWALVLVALALFGARERARLARVERVERPAELAAAARLGPVAPGRTFAGGLVLFDRDHPVLLARGPAGLAINLAHPQALLWGAYLIGLCALAAYQAI